LVIFVAFNEFYLAKQLKRGAVTPTKKYYPPTTDASLRHQHPFEATRAINFAVLLVRVIPQEQANPNW
jgi:hypothetical protein